MTIIQPQQSADADLEVEDTRQRPRVQEISNSELGTFLTCPAKWGFEYEDLLRPIVEARVLTWGNCIHAGLEGGYKAAFSELATVGQRLSCALVHGRLSVSEFHGRYLQRLDQAVRGGVLDETQAQERWDDANAMLDVAHWAVEHYFEVTRDDLETLIPLGFEVPFRVPVYDKSGRPSCLYLKGKIDGLWWDPEGEQVIVDDAKTSDELVGTTEKRIALDPQMSGYQHAARHMLRTGNLWPLDGSTLPEGASERIGRSRYNVIRRSHPKVPSINKLKIKKSETDPVLLRLAALEAETEAPQGFVSAAAIDTTAAIYQAELDAQEERGLPATDKQRELVERLRRQGDRYFARFEFWRSAQDLERWRTEIWINSRRMREAARLPVLRTRNHGACTQAHSLPCAWRAVCLDDQPETRALYRVAKQRHEEVGL